MRISSAFDSGNIRCLTSDDPADIQLEIKVDAGDEFYQWFHYRLSGAARTPCCMRIVNAGGASYTRGWEGYEAVASYDRETWFRVPTTYGDGVLTIDHTPEADAVWYAYFAPYSLERHADLVAHAQIAKSTALLVPGTTVDGRDLDVLRATTGDGSGPVCWIIARQHPGESMAEWLINGLMDRLLNEADPVGRDLLARATFYIVPNMNPDGSYRGHLRTNAAGRNLNREWADPDPAASPEVFHIRRLMEETGCDFFLDVHGDEALPYNFIAGPDGVPSLTEHQIGLVRAYEAALCDLNADFQREFGYPTNAPGKANLKIGGNWVAERFGCPAMTLEQPFKDNAGNPEPVHGWSPARAEALGRSCLDALAVILPDMS